MLTSKLGMDGSYNIAYGLDGLFKVIGDEYLTLKMDRTFENGVKSDVFDNSPSRYMVEWEHRNEKGFGYDFLYSYSGDKFNPGMGFETRQDYQVLGGKFQYGWFSGKNSPIRYQKIFITGQSISSSVNGSLESGNGSARWQFNAKKGFGGSVTGSWFFEELTDTLILGNRQAYVPPGGYKFCNLVASFNTYSGNGVSARFSTKAGNFYDGWKFSLSSAPSFSIFSDLDLGLTYNLDYVKFASRKISFTNHIIGLRGLLTSTTKISYSAFIQYNTSVNRVMTNMRFRYNPREGNDFYIVYDEGFNTNIYRENPSLSYSSGRTILLKYTYTFALKKI